MLRLRRASGSRFWGARENGGVLADSAIPCSSIITYGPRQSAQQLHRSVHPLDLGRARGNEPARIPQWHPGQYEFPINDEPRHQPARLETRPNQRLYVPLGSPPSVAVGSLSARAAHRSRAPQNDKSRMTSMATPVKISRCEAAKKQPKAVERSIAEVGLSEPLLAPASVIGCPGSVRVAY